VEQVPIVIDQQKSATLFHILPLVCLPRNSDSRVRTGCADRKRPIQPACQPPSAGASHITGRAPGGGKLTGDKSHALSPNIYVTGRLKSTR
jgi:hypothetical protein